MIYGGDGSAWLREFQESDVSDFQRLKPYTDAGLRKHHYGDLQPMDEPPLSTGELLFRWCCGIAIVFAIGIAVIQ